MSRKSKTQHLTDGIAGQHLALAVAAHLARSQLVPDPLKVYDAQHMSDMLNFIALALARTAPLYVPDPLVAEPRQLAPAELDGAAVKRGATVLELKDGRMLAGVTIRRADLRQAVAILKAIGLREIAPQFAAVSEPQPTNAKRDPGADEQALMARLAELEETLQPPLIPAHVEKAKQAALFIARHAPQGRIANLAMQLMSSLHDARAAEDVPGGFRMALARLRAALEIEVPGGGYDKCRCANPPALTPSSASTSTST